MGCHISRGLATTPGCRAPAENSKTSLINRLEDTAEQTAMQDQPVSVVQFQCLDSTLLVDESSTVSTSLCWRWISPSMFFCYVQAAGFWAPADNIIFIDARTEASSPQHSDILPICPYWATPIQDILSLRSSRANYIKNWLAFRTLVLFESGEVPRGNLAANTETFLKWIIRLGIAVKTVYVLDGNVNDVLTQNDSRYGYALREVPRPHIQHPLLQHKCCCDVSCLPSSSPPCQVPSVKKAICVLEIIPPSNDSLKQNGASTGCQHTAGSFSLFISPNHPSLIPVESYAKSTALAKAKSHKVHITSLDALRVTTVVSFLEHQLFNADQNTATSLEPYASKLSMSRKAQRRTFHTLCADGIQSYHFSAGTTVARLPVTVVIQLVWRCSTILHKAVPNEERVLLVDDAQGLLAAFAATWFLVESGNTLSAATQQIQRKCVGFIQIPAEWQQVLHKFASLVNEGWPLLKARTEALRDLPAAFSEETSSTTSATNNQHTSVQTSSTKANTQLPYIDATFSEMKKSLSDKDFIDAVRVIRVLLRNILQHPDDPKYRVVKLTNPKFQSAVGRHATGIKFLEQVGWVSHENALNLPNYVQSETLRTAAALLVTLD